MQPCPAIPSHATCDSELREAPSPGQPALSKFVRQTSRMGPVPFTRATQLPCFQSRRPVTSANASMTGVSASRNPAHGQRRSLEAPSEVPCFHRASGTVKKELPSNLNKTEHNGR